MMRNVPLIVLTLAGLAGAEDAPSAIRDPIPDRLVVLTFDDASRSHYTNVAPLLKEYGFGATFFITEGFDFQTNKVDYLTWEQIKELHEDGFEIGNHTRDHLGITDKNVDKLAEQLEGIAARCDEHGIPRPVTFAWPGNAITEKGFATLSEHGIRFARRGGAPEYSYETGRGFAYEPGRDHPLLIPSAGDARPTWTLPDFIRAVDQARDGKIAVIQFHGVPDTAHDWVSLSLQDFEACLKYLQLNNFHVVALRDLENYVDLTITPDDPWAIVESRRDRAAIDEFAINYGRAFESGNIDDILEMVTDDFVALSPDKPPISGKQRVREEIEADFQTLQVQRLIFEHAEVKVTSETAYAWGTSTATVLVNLERITVKGKYLWVLQRGSDGTWKLARDSSSGNGEEE